MNKFKKRVRALAAELNIPYQAAHNLLTRGNPDGVAKLKITEANAKQVLFRLQCMMIECWGPVDTFNWTATLSFDNGVPRLKLLGETSSDPDELLRLVSLSIPPKRSIRPLTEAFTRPADLESNSDLIVWLPDALRAAHLRPFFWAIEQLGPVIEPLLPPPWNPIRRGEEFNARRAVCFVHPWRMDAVTRVMDGKEVTEEEATYMEKAYGPDWRQLGPEWTSRFYERGF